MSGDKNSEKIEYLEEERKKLWQRLSELEKQVAERPSNIEKEAKQASKKTAEYRNRAEERLDQANEIYTKIVAVESEINSNLDEINTGCKQLKKDVDKQHEDNTKLSNLLIKVNEILEEYPVIEKEIEQLCMIDVKIQESSSKINAIHKEVLSKKIEIDEIHREILGYEDEDENQEKVSVEGLKDQLETTYDELNETAKNLEEKFKEIEEINQKNMKVLSIKIEMI